MSKALSALLLLCAMAHTAIAQQNACATKDKVRLSKARPTVFITLESAGKGSPNSAQPTTAGGSAASATSGKASDSLKLRLHNNTRWAISFSTDILYLGSKITPFRLCDGRSVLGLKDGTDVKIRYEVEAEQGEEMDETSAGGVAYKPIKVTAPVIHRSDVSSTSWLPPGRSIVFDVPRDYLARRLLVYVPFKYEWETGEKDSGTNEPQHRVYIRGSGL